MTLPAIFSLIGMKKKSIFNLSLHWDHLWHVLECLYLTNTKPVLSKCDFYVRQIHYWGHFLSQQGISHLPKRFNMFPFIDDRCHQCMAWGNSYICLGNTAVVHGEVCCNFVLDVGVMWCQGWAVHHLALVVGIGSKVLFWVLGLLVVVQFILVASTVWGTLVFIVIKEAR